jgi:hypothetical protein
MNAASTAKVVKPNPVEKPPAPAAVPVGGAGAGGMAGAGMVAADAEPTAAPWVDAMAGASTGKRNPGSNEPGTFRVAGTAVNGAVAGHAVAP